MIRDDDQRLRAIQAVDHSLVVEASAGTGKTSTLINRILHLVLEEGPEGPPLRLSNIAAITFTEKAAGEMKVKLRRKLEPLASTTGIKGERACQALRDLEIAAISTFHAFAVGLLKERPVEAGLDPRFTAIDEIQSEILFKEVWEGWLAEGIRQRREPIERAIRAGLGLQVLRDLARTFRLNSRIVRELNPTVPPSHDQIQTRLEELLGEGKILLNQVVDSQDKLAECLAAAVGWLESAAIQQVSRSGDAPAGRLYKGRGAVRNWVGGAQTVERVRDFVTRVLELSGVTQRRLLHDVDRWIVNEFLPVWEKSKRDRAVLDFDDQLLAARDLLRKSRAARRDFQKQFATVLVDEFQDTDALQLEIVLLLSSTDLGETDPARLHPAPGRLFIVGDPKQSIYRFRGADIETYLKMVEPARSSARGLERLELTTNFRSVPSILRFVDDVFSEAMKPPSDGDYQPTYLSFGGKGTREETRPPAVRILSNERDESPSENSSKGVVQREASRIARLVDHINHNAEWMISERVQEGATAHETERLPRYGDIAILLPVLSSVDVLEDALREAAIPYILEGGKFYYARSEVSSALTVLRAVTNPNDGVALHGALRSIFFGLSDEDLLRAHVEGLPLDYRQIVPASSPLAHAYRILLDLHSRRHDRSASETFEILLRETGAREVLFSRSGGRQSLANLNKLARTLRARQSEATLSEVLDILETLDDQGLAESESRVMEERSNAVRILTIHKAKGLDFPIVIMGGLGLQRKRASEHFLADRHEKNFYAFSAGSKESGWQSEGWYELVEGERRRQDAELIRLLYVAMTRARDHLVVSTHCKRTKGKRDAGLEPRLMGTGLEPLSRFLSTLSSEKGSLARVLDLEALIPGPRKERGTELRDLSQDWIDILRRERAQIRRLVTDTPASREVKTPSGSAPGVLAEDRAQEERVSDAARARSIRLGIAFHEAMEAADFGQEGRIKEWAEEAGQRNRLDGSGVAKVEEMMRNIFRSQLIARVRASEASGAKLWRELPFVRPATGNAIQEGKIDLIFEEEGEWQVVDYKTDQVVAEDSVLQDRYRAQMQDYAIALRALGLRVKAAYLLFARTGRHLEIPI